jgi:prevent-host-death family protein
MQVNMLEAKNRLSTLIVAAERDEEVVIARNGVPVAKIIKYTAPKVAPPGVWKGRSSYAADWDIAETNIEIERLFAGASDASAA